MMSRKKQEKEKEKPRTKPGSLGGLAISFT
jgi:hypothetical protein